MPPQQRPDQPSKSPLEGLLDFSHALAGPYCTLLLSDYGARVFKLEAQSGDMGRGWGPPFAGGISSFFLGLNRGKEGISIDLKQPEGLDLCLRIIDTADVLVENFRPGAMDRLGLGTRQFISGIRAWSIAPSQVTASKDLHATRRPWI